MSRYLWTGLADDIPATRLAQFPAIRSIPFLFSHPPNAGLGDDVPIAPNAEKRKCQAIGLQPGLGFCVRVHRSGASNCLAARTVICRVSKSTPVQPASLPSSSRRVRTLPFRNSVGCVDASMYMNDPVQTSALKSSVCLFGGKFMLVKSL